MNLKDKYSSDEHNSVESARLKARIAELERQLDTGDSERFLNQFFINTVIGLYQTTPNGQILSVNPALLSMLGFESFEELSHRNLNKIGYQPGYSRSLFLERIEREGRVVVMAKTRRNAPLYS